MEEVKTKARNISNKENEGRLRETMFRFQMADCNLETLFQNCFKDRESTQRLIELYKKYNQKDSKSATKSRMPVLLTEQSSSYKLSSKEPRSQSCVKKHSTGRKLK